MSIRARLFLILMVTTGIVWMSAVAWIYFGTRAEIERVLDARLVEAARMVDSLIASQEIDPQRAARLPLGREPAPAMPHASYGRQLSCQIWAFDGTLVGRSDGAPGAPLTDDAAGFSEREVDGEIWRVYAVENLALGVRVLVGDNLGVRDRLVADVIRGLALPALLILPILAALIWLSVGKGLAPLNALAAALGSRGASDLAPLPEAPDAAEIRPVVRSLNGLFARVSAARDHERAFTAFAAHELRTPIAGLKTQAQVALGSEDRDIRGNALRQIVVGVDRTARLIRQLTDLTRMDSGGCSDDVEDFDVGGAVQAVAADMGQQHPGRAPVAIELRSPPLDARQHRTLLVLAVRNLLENAVLHAPPDGVVRCHVCGDGRAISIGITDSGPGIPEDELPHVRDRFFRGRNRSPTGSGLGLAIADFAVARLGGALSLRNRPEGGVTAEIRFPRSVA